MSINFYIKTRGIVGDRRIEKEWDCFNDRQIAINLFYAANDEVERDVANFRSIKKIKLPGGAAPSNLILRLFGSIVFCVRSFFKVRRFSDQNIHWVNDPILFLLVILLSLNKSNYTIWDHHELPPDWLFRNKVIKFFFRIAYKRATCVIHTNVARRELLEEQLAYYHTNIKYLSNYPKKDEMGELTEVKLPKKINRGQFVFLQSTLGAHRADIEIFSALKKSGVHAVHAGKIDNQRLQQIEASIGPLDFCEFIGHRSVTEINFLLRNCLCTLIFYKSVSSNNLLCDPNRLYQSVAQNAWIISGNNPTILSELTEYPKAVCLQSVNPSIDEIIGALDKVKNDVRQDSLNDNANKNSFHPKHWDDYSDVFDYVAGIKKPVSKLQPR